MKKVWQLLLSVSWLTLILAASLEVMVHLFDLFLGQADGLVDLSLGVLKKLAWTLPLCLALALVMQHSLVMGMTGLLAAPLATLFSSILDSQLRELWLNIATDALSWASVQSAAFRGLEYGGLGALIGFLSESRRNSLLNHLYAGLVIGFVFGGLMIYQNWQVQGGPIMNTFLQNLAEVLFPLGCAVILKIVGRR